MSKKALTLDDLVKFCAETKLQRFSANDSGYKICVQVPSVYEKPESEDTGSMLYADLKLLHTNRNRNGSNVTKESAEKCMKSLKYKPVLANFCKIDGVEDFTSHDFEITEDGVNYLEHQVGCITSDEPTLKYDKDKDRYYLYAKAAIPREYTSAAEIIERKNGTKLSVELGINAMEYDAEKKELLLTDIEVIGVTLLGKNAYTGEDIQEGMEGARLDLADFSISNNAVNYDQNNKIIELLEQLNSKLSDFNIEAENSAKESEKGGKNQMKFEELLKKYNKTVEDIEFEYEGLSDEELEQAFAEAFAEGDGEDNSDEPESTSDEPEENTPAPIADEGDEDEESTSGNDDVPEKKIEYSITVDGITKTYSISVKDKVRALEELVNAAYSESDNAYYMIDVYEDEKLLVMKRGWESQKCYRQSYTEADGVFALVGDRVEVFAQFLTKEEIEEVDKMRSNYSSVSKKLAKYESEPSKMEILNSKDYEAISETSEFVELMKEDVHFDLSVEDVRKKADEILLNYAKAGKLSFAKAEPEKKDTGKKTFVSTKKANGRYGNIFAK
jgi:hypothetical protein